MISFEQFSIGAGAALFLLMLPAIYRIATGPTALDRIVAANIIGTKTAVILVIIGVIFERVDMFVDFALAYALLNFTGSLAAARFLHRSKETGATAAGTNPTAGEQLP